MQQPNSPQAQMYLTEIHSHFQDSVPELKHLVDEEVASWLADGLSEDLFSGPFLSHILINYLRSADPIQERETLRKIFEFLDTIMLTEHVNVRDQVSLYFGEAILDDVDLHRRMKSFMGPALTADLELMATAQQS